jgi:hypothetical protein
MITIPNKKHALKKKLKVKIDKQERLKFLIFKHQMPTPRRHMLLLEFLLPLLVER